MFSESTANGLLVSGPAAQSCLATVVIPGRNEEALLPRCLQAMAQQQTLMGEPLPLNSFEILLLLNNCTDQSARVVHRWHGAHPDVALHVVERTFPGDRAHVGTARHLLMNTAAARLARAGSTTPAILSTDADTVVAPDWIAQNLRSLEHGADVVGGRIELLPEELADLPCNVRHCYRQDRLYACLVAQLEDALDPQPGDPWPRHLDHFGSSLACTPRAYTDAGGMPPVSPLEDEAFVDRVRRAGLLLRHDPAVKVFTSARLHGRAELGLAKQFVTWSKLANPCAHTVLSANFLEYRFRFMRRLRHIYQSRDTGDLFLPTPWWQETFADALDYEVTCPAFLGAIYCNILVAESYERDTGKTREEPIADAIAGLRSTLASMDRSRQGALTPAADATDSRPCTGTVRTT